MSSPESDPTPPEPCEDAIKTAREAFPRGLEQPEGRFRFGMDALLLAAFAALGAKDRVLDIGCGCGAAGLAALLLHGAGRDAGFFLVGVDIDPAMVEAAQRNAERLGLCGMCRFFCLDARDFWGNRDTPDIAAESCDSVLANPPYYRPDQGRRPSGAARQAATFETSGGLEAFVAAGSHVLRNKGRFHCVYPAQRLAEAFAVLAARRLEPKRLRLVHSRVDENAYLALIQCRKNGKPGLLVAPPLILYARHGAASRLTDAALEFCPFLACNARTANDREP